MGVTILTSIEGCKKLCHKSTIQYIYYGARNCHKSTIQYIMEQEEIVSQIYYSIYYGALHSIVSIFDVFSWNDSNF